MTNLQLWKNRIPQKTLLDDVWSLLDDVNIERPGANGANFLPVAVDVKETKDNFVFAFDIPGISKDDISIDIKGNQLTVSGERNHEEKLEDEQVYRIERSYGKFSRSFELPDGVDFDQVQAGYENGVLKIAVPKGEVGKTRKVKIGDSTKGFLKNLTKKQEPHSKVVNS